MNDSLEAIKRELERYGEANDAATTDHARSMLNITRDTGELLNVLVRATLARRVLEIGTSNGYSTIWLAEAAKEVGGIVMTVEFAEYKVGLAAVNFQRAGLSPFIEQIHDEAARFLRQTDANAYDMVFLDSDRVKYGAWWPDVRRVLRPGGLMVVDNATTHAEEMAPFISMVQADAQFTTCLVPIGKGEFMAVKGSA
jgi:predicted O-methyltransferase YrrM